MEWQFTCHVIDIVLSSPNFAWRLHDLGLLNTLPALYLIFAIDDAFYAPLHLLMHRPWFYPYVHKHHHRQQLPERGYADAGNEHPIEQVLGLSVFVYHFGDCWSHNISACPGDLRALHPVCYPSAPEPHGLRRPV